MVVQHCFQKMRYLEHIFFWNKIGDATQGSKAARPSLLHRPKFPVAVSATRLSRWAECGGCCCCSQAQPVEVAILSECGSGNAVVCLHCRVHLSLAKKNLIP